MEFVKKHLFNIVTLIVMIIITVVGIAVVKGKLNEKSKYEDEVNRIIEAEKSFVTSSYALTTDNVDRAQANLEFTKQKFDAVIKELTDKYPPPVIDADMTALKFKLYLRQVCIKMENLLRGEDVWIPDNLKYFSYDRYMAPDVLPSNEEIVMIRKQLEIIQELMFLISQSQIKQLKEFVRLNEFNMEKRDLYSLMPFSLVLVGNINTLRSFLNSLHDARFFFMVRNIDFQIRDVPIKTPPAAPGGKIEPLPKNKRLAFSNELREITARILLDYFEFHDKE